MPIKHTLAFAAALTLTATASFAQCIPQSGDYIITDPIAFGLKASKAIPARDQFDTDDDYRAKVAKGFEVLRSELGPDFSGQVAIVVDRSQTVQFDPQRGVLSIPSIANERYALGSIRPVATGSKGYHGAYLATLGQERSTYETTNGFGAPVTVQKITRKKVGFAWDNKLFKMSNNGSLGSPMRQRIEGLSGEQAREFSSGLKATIRGKLVFPYVSFETIPGYPTFSDPVDNTQENVWLYLEPDLVCVAGTDGQPITQWTITRR